MIGVTQASAAETRRYRFEQRLSFPVLAEAQDAHEHWGVDMIWGVVLRLVDPQGHVVAGGFDKSRRKLAERSSGR